MYDVHVVRVVVAMGVECMFVCVTVGLEVYLRLCPTLNGTFF